MVRKSGGGCATPEKKWSIPTGSWKSGAGICMACSALMHRNQGEGNSADGFAACSDQLDSQADFMISWSKLFFRELQI